MQNAEEQILGMPDVPVTGGQPGENSTESPAMNGPEKPKDKPKNKEDEKELLERMMFSPSSTGADSTLEITSTTDEEDFKPNKPTSKELLKMLEKDDNNKISEKYKKELLNKALKDPSSIEVNTPNGWMTVRDAIDAGYNLATGEFDQEPIPKPDLESKLATLDPREADTIRRLTQRGTPQAGLAPMGPSGEMSLEEAGVEPRPDVNPMEGAATEAGMAQGAAPEIPLGM